MFQTLARRALPYGGEAIFQVALWCFCHPLRPLPASLVACAMLPIAAAACGSQGLLRVPSHAVAKQSTHENVVTNCIGVPHRSQAWARAHGPGPRRAYMRAEYAYGARMERAWYTDVENETRMKFMDCRSNSFTLIRFLSWINNW